MSGYPSEAIHEAERQIETWILSDCPHGDREALTLLVLKDFGRGIAARMWHADTAPTNPEHDTSERN
ncbi:MAG: hypothetical protein LH624_11640 [Cryobacterium sp.]|nr:hypothetical protein [Cryobacterium sp.]